MRIKEMEDFYGSNFTCVLPGDIVTTFLKNIRFGLFCETSSNRIDQFMKRVCLVMTIRCLNFKGIPGSQAAKYPICGYYDTKENGSLGLKAIVWRGPAEKKRLLALTFPPIGTHRQNPEFMPCLDKCSEHHFTLRKEVITSNRVT